MKKILSVLATLILVLGVLPATFGVSTGGGVNPIIEPEEFEPYIWLCDSRAVMDDNVEPGRITLGGYNMTEREHNYAFEGEQIEWKVLVMDKNGIEKIKDVYVSVDDEIEANCKLTQILKPKTNRSDGDSIDADCNARIGEEKFTSVPEGYENVFAEYTFTVEKAFFVGLIPARTTVVENVCKPINNEVDCIDAKGCRPVNDELGKFISCEECPLSLTVCTDYTTQSECENNHCNLGNCEWQTNRCVEVV